MSIRKIVAAGGFAIGAALAFAPLAAADNLGSTVDTEVSGLNDLFTVESFLAGDGADVITSTTPGVFDTIPLADAPVAGTSPLDYLLYGLNPAVTGPSSDPGAYDVFNGALTEFSDAYNSAADGLLNGDTTLIPDADLFGSSSEIATALGTGTDFGAAADFLSNGIGDLAGFFDLGALF
jgi:hypothetical protein